MIREATRLEARPPGRRGPAAAIGSDRFQPALRALAVLTLVLAAGSCSDSGNKPTPPLLATHSLSGRVRLESNLFDLSGNPTGRLLLRDTDGISVRLEKPDGDLDSTQTADGRYVFNGLKAGRYRLSTSVLSNHPIRIPDVDLGDADLEAPDTLVLGPLGELKTSPNPSAPEGFGLEFTLEGVQDYALEILDLAGHPVWSYSGSGSGFTHIHWDGDDLTEHVVPEGYYWSVLHVNGTEAYNLAYWAHGDEQPSPGNCGHIEAEGLFVQRAGTVLSREWRGALEGDLAVRTGDLDTGYELRFLRADSTAYAIADTCPENRMTWTVEDSSIVAVRQNAESKWSFDLLGKSPGSTTLILNGWHEDHIHISSLPIPVTVTAARGGM